MKATVVVLVAMVAVAMAAPPLDDLEEEMEMEVVEEQPRPRAAPQPQPQPQPQWQAPLSYDQDNAQPVLRKSAPALGPRYRTRGQKPQQPDVRTHVAPEPARGRCPYGQKMDALRICREVWD